MAVTNFDMGEIEAELRVAFFWGKMGKSLVFHFMIGFE
jgi:hypothetical protein